MWRRERISWEAMKWLRHADMATCDWLELCVLQFFRFSVSTEERITDFVFSSTSAFRGPKKNLNNPNVFLFIFYFGNLLTLLNQIPKVY